MKSACSHDLVVTDGVSFSLGDVVDSPGARATVTGSGGTYASIVFRYWGSSTVISALGSGVVRKQIGLKLRAQDPCNLLYLMWRTDERLLYAQSKLNPGCSTSAQCGNEGYTTLASKMMVVPPIPEVGRLYEIRASIVGGNLWAQIDDGLASCWTIPPEFTPIGASGLRTDNVKFELIAVRTD